jgi:glucosamine-6-phosphate deaminase
MEVVIVDDVIDAEHQIAALAADTIGDLLARKARPVLGVATGSTPVPAYEELIRRNSEGSLDFATTRFFMLDEYLGLPPGHSKLYRRFIEEHLIMPLGLPADTLSGPDIEHDDVKTAARHYEQLIHTVGGIDLQILGIGSDGHIGFNEPTSSLASRTRIKTLTPQTRADNSRFFDDDIDQVPSHVITQGIGTILEARHLLLIATGSAKANAVAATIEGPISAMVPASALQLHPHVTILADRDAAAGLQLVDYYQATFRTKPSWQGL